MKKRSLVLIIFIIFFSIVVGCSTNEESFDDKRIIFKVVDTQDNEESKSNLIEITNESGFNLDNLSLEISHRAYDSNDNYKLEAIKTLEGFSLNKAKNILISLPVVQDIESVEIDLQGDIIIKKNKKAPFEIGGVLKALIESP